MKIIKSKGLAQKIITSIIFIVVLFNVVLPTTSHAFDWGGALWSPIQKLVCGLGDTVYNLLQKNFIEGAPKAVVVTRLSEVKNENKFWSELQNVLVKAPGIQILDAWWAGVIGDDNADLDGDGNVTADEEKFYWGKEIPIPSIYYSVENIFANKIPAFDVNFINPSVENPEVVPNGLDIKESAENGGESTNEENTNNESENGNGKAIGNIALQIQGTIATWYKALRNLAIVAMLSILVYIAIRIIISSASTEEAKYKIMLKDWFVAICLLFSMHYIMSFSLNVTESLTEMINKSYQNALSQITTENGITSQTLATSVRFQVEFAEDTGDAMGYTILYAILVIYTIMFTWQYLKRVIYMAFLTLISPLVAMTYPIDKINDGKAQGFNMWFREYIFNLLLQPLHLLLFTILALSAVDLFKTNVIYSLVVLGFLTQAIKILKKLFGFDSKAPIGGGGLAGGFAGGAVFTALLNATKRIPQVTGGKSSNDSSSKGIRTANNSNFELPDTGQRSLGDLSSFGNGASSARNSGARNPTTADSTIRTATTPNPETRNHMIENPMTEATTATNPMTGNSTVTNSMVRNSTNQRRYRLATRSRNASPVIKSAQFHDNSRNNDENRQRQNRGVSDSLDTYNPNKTESKGNSTVTNDSVGDRFINSLNENNQSPTQIRFKLPPDQRRYRLATRSRNASPVIKSAQFHDSSRNNDKNRQQQNQSVSENNEEQNQRQNQGVSDSLYTYNPNKTEGKGRRMIRGVANLGRRYINVPKILKTAAKVGTGVIGAGTLGTIGVAAGLASDDMADVAKYGAAGLAGGYAVGSKAASSVANITSAVSHAPSNVRNTFEQGYYGSDYGKVKRSRDYKKNKEIKEYYKDKYGSNWKEKYEIGKKLQERGNFDNQNDIDKGIKLVDRKLGIDEATDVILFSKKVGANFSSLSDEKKRKGIEEEAKRILGGDETKVKEIMEHLDSIRL